MFNIVIFSGALGICIRHIYRPLLPVIFTLIFFIPDNYFESSLIGPDDHYETLKSFQVYSGKVLGLDVWTDHPPLASLINGFLFKILGYTPFACRLHSLIFLYIFYFSIHALTCKDLTIRSFLSFLISFFILSLCAPDLQIIILSNMLEFPAVALSVFSYAILSCQIFSHKYILNILISAFIFSCALFVKFAAVPFMFAHILYIILDRIRFSGSEMVHFFFTYRLAVVWVALVMVSLAFLSSLFLKGGFSSLVYGHLYSSSFTGHHLGGVSMSFYDAIYYYPFVILFPIIFIEFRNFCFDVSYILLYSLIPIVIAHFAWEPFWYFYYIHYMPHAVILVSASLRKLFDYAFMLSSPRLRCSLIILYVIGLLVIAYYWGKHTTYSKEDTALSDAVREYINTLPAPNSVFTLSTEILCFTDTKICDYYTIFPKKRMILYSDTFSIFCIVANECEPDYIIDREELLSPECLRALKILGYYPVDHSLKGFIVLKYL